MAIDVNKYIEKIKSGQYSRKELETLRKNAMAKEGMDKIISACDEELSYGLGNKTPDTKEIGFQETLRELKRRECKNIETLQSGNKRTISFESPNGDTYHITTRSKNTGTWQTTIDYGEKTNEPPFETNYWVFIDIETSPPRFYITPEWWIINNIWEVHSNYLRKYGGKRAKSDDSKHHGITLDRIKKWESQWDLLGL